MSEDKHKYVTYNIIDNGGVLIYICTKPGSSLDLFIFRFFKPKLILISNS